MAACGSCSGTGTCPHCDGKGWITMRGHRYECSTKCGDCQGTGRKQED